MVSSEGKCPFLRFLEKRDDILKNPQADILKMWWLLLLTPVISTFIFPCDFIANILEKDRFHGIVQHPSDLGLTNIKLMTIGIDTFAIHQAVGHCGCIREEVPSSKLSIVRAWWTCPRLFIMEAMGPYLDEREWEELQIRSTGQVSWQSELQPLEAPWTWFTSRVYDTNWFRVSQDEFPYMVIVRDFSNIHAILKHFTSRKLYNWEADDIPSKIEDSLLSHARLIRSERMYQYGYQFGYNKRDQGCMVGFMTGTIPYPTNMFMDYGDYQKGCLTGFYKQASEEEAKVYKPKEEPKLIQQEKEEKDSYEPKQELKPIQEKKDEYSYEPKEEPKSVAQGKAEKTKEKIDDQHLPPPAYEEPVPASKESIERTLGPPPVFVM